MPQRTGPERAPLVPLDSHWIDVSVSIRSGMVHWPDDPAVEIDRIADMAEGYTVNLSTLSMSAHTGTHIDAPLHMIADGPATEQAPLSVLLGEAQVIEIDGQTIRPEHLQGTDIQPGDRILLKTTNSQRCWKANHFVENYVGVSPSAADHLAERKVALVGIDYLSIGPYGPENEQTHLLLLHAGIWIIEGLDLSAAGPGRYDMVCLPLRIVGTEGAPARVILRRRLD